jgi:hypothetical protein
VRGGGPTGSGASMTEAGGGPAARSCLSPCLILWIGACIGWLSPPNGDLGST